MFISRVIAIQKSGIDAQELSTPDRVNAAFDDKIQAPSNCFKNLFEMPVIFYALTALIVLLEFSDQLFLNLAWSYVGLRALQACVHCTYNKVIHRFMAYLASALVLWFMVGRLFLMLI